MKKRDVRRAARGDEDAAAALFDDLYLPVYRYAFAEIGNEEDAEDATAETFARTIRFLDRFRRRGHLVPHVFRIAGDVVADYAPAEHATDNGLRALVDGLSENQRRVVLLRFAAGLETRETAGVLGTRSSTVRQLQLEALELLRRRIASSTASS